MMRYLIALILAAGCFHFTGSAQTTYRVLFLGNSYTYVNSLPVIAANLALAGGDSLIHDSSTPGGYTLEAHSTNTNSLGKIALGTWDYVVLQDQSQRPSFSPGQVAQQVYPYAAILVDSIRSANPCTEPVFYMTWGRKNGDQANCANYPPICTYEGMQTRLKTSYVQMANDNSCTVAPCGIGFWESRLQDPNLELYSADESHPSYAGSYLSACVFYATFFRKSPVGLNFYGSLDSMTATFLQNVAETVVMDSVSQWRIGANDVNALFSSTTTNDQVDFTDQSNNATSWFWDFGDGNTSTLENPVNIYAASGTYTVTLIATDGCTSDTTTETVTLTIVGTPDPEGNLFQLTPNPSPGIFRIDADFDIAQETKLEIWDMQGKLMYQSSWEVASGKNQQQISLTGIASGNYLVKLNSENGVRTSRLVIQ